VNTVSEGFDTEFGRWSKPTHKTGMRAALGSLAVN